MPKSMGWNVWPLREVLIKSLPSLARLDLGEFKLHVSGAHGAYLLPDVSSKHLRSMGITWE